MKLFHPYKIDWLDVGLIVFSSLMAAASFGMAVGFIIWVIIR